MRDAAKKAARIIWRQTEGMAESLIAPIIDSAITESQGDAVILAEAVLAASQTLFMANPTHILMPDDEEWEEIVKLARKTRGGK